MLSVVIPTRDRSATLARTLEGVLSQSAPPDGFEVVVVDNGSTDATPRLLRELQARFPTTLHCLHEPLRGPAAARNRGARAARGECLLFLGDDMEPADENLLVRHAELHARRPEPTYAVLGRATWSDREPVTPLMRWLEPKYQFGFELLAPGPVSTAERLYTAHVSLKKAVFDAVGGFDPQFPYAAVEDIELGMRLAEEGVVLDYHPELLVLHSHQITLARWLQRMTLVGRSAALLERLHPDAHIPKTVTLPKGARWACVRAAAPLVAPLGDHRVPRRVRELRWRILHHASYARGYLEGPPVPAEPVSDSPTAEAA